MKSPCAILVLLPLLLFATTIESRNEPGATATNYQPTHNHIHLNPNPSGPSHGPIMIRPIPSRLYGVRSDPSNGSTHSGQSDNKESQERVKYLGQRCRSSPIAYSYNEDFKTPKSSVKDLDAKPSFTMIFSDGFKQISSPTNEYYSRLTPDVDNVAIAHFLEKLGRASLSHAKATPGVAAINMDVETPKKSLYNNFRPAYAAPYYGYLQRPLLSPVKATPDVATTNIAVKALMKSLFRATPYASPYSGDVVPKGKNPHAQPSTPWNTINWS